MLRSFLSCVAGALLACVGLGAATASAQSVTVVEYYNKALDAHFITGKVPEQTALDAQAGFQRTGMTFQAVSAATAAASLTKICRFYISSTTPYTSSHFYGRQGVDCESIRAQNLAGFAWEDYDFATAQPASGACASGSTAIYRGFRVGANGKTSNHRYSASLANYNAAIATGYVGENIAFCASSATATSTVVAPPVGGGAGECSYFFGGGKRVTLQNLAGQAGIATSFVRSSDFTPTTYRGVNVVRVIDTGSDGSVYEIFLEDRGSGYAEIGSRSKSSTSTVENYYTPPIVFPKVAVIGNVINYSRAITQLPTTAGSDGTQTGVITFVGLQSVTVPVGTFNACLYTVDVVDERPSIGARVVTTSKSWFLPGTGLIRFTSNSKTTAFGFTVDGDTELVATKIE